MIIKSLSRKKNGGQLIKYVLRYLVKDTCKTIYKGKENDLHEPNQLFLRHNIRSRSLNGIIAEYAENEKYRLVKRKDSCRLFHYIVGFGAKDRELVTPKVLKATVQKFIELRGENNLYCAAAHFNTQSTHVHIIVSVVSLNGRSARLSKQQYKSLILSLDEFQRTEFPFLVHSQPNHRKSYSKERMIKQFDQVRESHKHELGELIKKSFAKSHSEKEFAKAIAELGVECYYRNGSLQGVVYKKKKFRFNKLGFDVSQLQSKPQEKQLLELKNIREGNWRLQRDRTIRSIVMGSVSTIERQRLGELTRIRSNRTHHSDKGFTRIREMEDLNEKDTEDHHPLAFGDSEGHGDTSPSH